MIGIVAGAGPYAGLDLTRKIFEETVAHRDQDHLDVLSLFAAAAIPDRTRYLLGEEPVNPAAAIARQVLRLAAAGATVAAIPCNTAHAPPIFDAITTRLPAIGGVQFLHMIGETGAFLRRQLPASRRVAVLSTTGTWQAGVYPSVLEPLGFDIVVSDAVVQRETVHPAIYDPAYGIKATGGTPRARRMIDRAAAELAAHGAGAVILGCTELPLIVDEPFLAGMRVIDPTRILARALIAAVAPAKLKPWRWPD